jgi:hypothetical protein
MPIRTVIWSCTNCGAAHECPSTSTYRPHIADVALPVLMESAFHQAAGCLKPWRNKGPCCAHRRRWIFGFSAAVMRPRRHRSAPRGMEDRARKRLPYGGVRLPAGPAGTCRRPAGWATVRVLHARPGNRHAQQGGARSRHTALLQQLAAEYLGRTTGSPHSCPSWSPRPSHPVDQRSITTPASSVGTAGVLPPDRSSAGVTAQEMHRCGKSLLLRRGRRMDGGRIGKRINIRSRGALQADFSTCPCLVSRNFGEAGVAGCVDVATLL